MSTKNQKRRNNHLERTETVNETVVTPNLVENLDLGEHDVMLAGPFKAKSPIVEKTVVESLSNALKEEISSEIKPKTGENENEENELVSAGQSRTFYPSAKSVKNKSFQNNDTNLSRKTPLLMVKFIMNF